MFISFLSRWLLPIIISSGIPFFMTSAGHTHPYYVSVTEIEYSLPEREIQIACKIFTDDFEYVLKEQYKNKVDIYHPLNKQELHKQITGYIQKHLQLKTDNQAVPLQFIGFEIEGEATWCYFSAGSIPPVKKIEIYNDLLYEYKKEQVNIVHTKIGQERKSIRLTYPKTDAIFSF